MLSSVSRESYLVCEKSSDTHTNACCLDAASNKHIESVKAIAKGLEGREDGMPALMITFT